jgi:uncharacterized protein HemY
MPRQITLLTCLTLSCISLQVDATPGEQLTQQAIRDLAVHGPEAQESQLRLLISENPADTTLHFRLGNLLSGQQRWGEARIAYTRAAERNFEHPDVQYNLAVVLDHLEQRKMAAHHYLLALRAARSRTHHFKLEAARQRLKAMGVSES